MYWWECRAEYADGTMKEYLRPAHDCNDDEQFRLEEELINKHPDCIWYTVNFVIAE